MLESGLIVAGTVLPNRAMDLTLRVMNPTGKPIQLQKGVRCNTEAFEVIEHGNDPQDYNMCSHVSQVEQMEAEAVLAPLWNNVKEEVTEAEREKLKDII